MQRLSLLLPADGVRNIETFSASCLLSAVDGLPRLARLAPFRPTIFIPADSFFLRSAMSSGSDGQYSVFTLQPPFETSFAQSYIIAFLHRIISTKVRNEQNNSASYRSSSQARHSFKLTVRAISALCRHACTTSGFELTGRHE